MNLDKVIEARRSVRRFHSKVPNWRKILDAVNCARKAPLAGNISSLKFILVDEVEKIAQLAESSGQKFVADVHFVLVVVSDTKEVVRSYDERGEKYANQQAGAAIENLLLKLTELKLGACWVGAFDDDQVKRILKIPEDSEPVAIIPIGFPLLKGSQKKKPHLDRCLYFNKYKGKFMKPRVEVDAF
ncbi:MAG: nitroreductase family protein [Nanoarchaeota archaeon]|nr:nitroreductase family protein [Nanoarchaeota archaeon]